MKSFRKLIVIILIFSFTLPLFSANDAGDAAAILRKGTSVRALGIGQAFTAVTNDVNTIYYNPSGSGFTDSSELSLMYQRYLEDEMSDDAFATLCGNYPMQNYGNIALGILYNYIGGIKETKDISGSTGVTFSDLYFVGLLNYSYIIKENLSIGTNIKYFYHKLWTYKGNTADIDIGAIYKIKDFNIGLSIQNILNSKFELEGLVPDYLPRVFKVGASYDYENKLLISAQTIFQQKRDVKFNIGLEFKPIEMVPLRLGYNSDNKDISFGAGLIMNKFNVDYVFVLSEMSNYNNLSIKIKF